MSHCNGKPMLSIPVSSSVYTLRPVSLYIPTTSIPLHPHSDQDYTIRPAELGCDPSLPHYTHVGLCAINTLSLTSHELSQTQNVP